MWNRLKQFLKEIDRRLTQGVYEHGHHLWCEPEANDIRRQRQSSPDRVVLDLHLLRRGR